MFSSGLSGVWRDFCVVFAHESIGAQLGIGIGLVLILVLALEGLRVSFFPTWFARRHLATLSHPAQGSHSHSVRIVHPANEPMPSARRITAPARRNKKKTVRRARRIAKPMRRLGKPQ